VERGKKEKYLATYFSVRLLPHRFVTNFIFDSFLASNSLFFDAGLLPGSSNQPVEGIVML
jgi:hypothetical protein